MPDGSLSTFRAERQSGLGGSDLGAILGLNPFRTPFQVWEEKTGRAEPFAGNLQTRFGQHAEQFVADEYCQRTGNRVQRFTSLLRHHSAPVIGHVDRLVIPDGAKIAAWRQEIRTDRGLEAKTAHALAAHRGDDWGDEGGDQIPASYLIQCQTYLELTGCAHWDLAVLFGNSDFRIYHLHRDPELGEYLVDEASRWWRDYVVADVPPPPSSELEARQRWPRHQAGKVLNATVEVGAQLRLLAQLRADMRALEAREKAVKDTLFPALADAEVVIYGGVEAATYRANRDSVKVDWQAMAEDLLNKYVVTQEMRDHLKNEHTRIITGARVLRLAKSLDAA